VYDPVARIGGMAHLVLPDNTSNPSPLSAGKFVNSGIPLIIEEMLSQGALKSRMVSKMAGGAKMFNIPGVQRFAGCRVTRILKCPKE
jgi:chemotaxis protein CheD